MRLTKPIPIVLAILFLVVGATGMQTNFSGASFDLARIAGNAISTGNGASGTGVQRVTIANDSTGTVAATQSGTWTMQPGNTANTTAWLIKDTTTTPILANALSTTVITVNSSAAVLTSYYCYNPNSSAAYVQIFDISGTVTLGTSTPKWSIAIPATSGANLAGLSLNFANAIKVAATTTATGSSAPSTALDCNFGYR